VIDSVHERLAKLVPDQGPAAIVHGDYRLDNTILGADGRVNAVLDWELCTLGDPLADVGLLMVYWSEAGDESPGALLEAATSLDGFPTRAELRARYAERSGRNVDQLDFYVAFGYWKLACILEGVYARYAGGVMGKDGAAFDGMNAQVVYLAERADQALDAMP
jgi:aminoglycoside phosphotransferase (APT) family kinase protein